jgi:hypothetical protein
MDMRSDLAYDIDEIMERNKAAGFHFFEPASMRFFNSRIHRDVYGGSVFITSEEGPDNVRRYTVREITDRGSIDKIGGFQAYATRTEAHAAAKEATT